MNFQISTKVTDNDFHGTNGGTEREVSFRYRLPELFDEDGNYDNSILLDDLVKELHKHFHSVVGEMRDQYGDPLRVPK
jgi:hypothetical protein